ncbi:MAG: family 10 glycosylhydrolase [Ignavibacteriales bacterium]|nr:family 10 glycosylhydrolase [Ignavibacteriales bacterium]
MKLAQRVLTVLLSLEAIVVWSASGQPSPKREFRGAWIATVTNLDWPSSRNLTPQEQRDQLVAILNDLHDAGLNAVIFQIRTECDALYNSPYEPWSYWLTGAQGTAPNPIYDPLEFAVAEAHKRGMEIHAWFNPYRAYRQTNTYATHATHVTNTHPEWVLTCPSGYKFLDPGLPQTRDFIAVIISDVIRRYDIDGVHMDDYFYPYPEHNFTVEDTASFSNYSRGFPDSLKADWRRDNVNLLVQQIHDSVQALKPWLKFGMSPFGIWKSGVPSGIFGLSAYDVIYCDAIAWLKQQSIDYLTPQLYWAFGGGQDYGKLQPWWADSAAAYGRHLYTGNAPFSLSGTEIENQINFNRVNPKVQGSVQFRANSIRFNTNGIRDRLIQNVFRHASAIPVMDWKETIPPNSPSNLQAVFNGGTGRYDLQWDSPAAATDGDTAARYVVYRFPTGSPTTEEYEKGENLLATAGGRAWTPRSSIDTPGVQYSFAVTALDENNNESGSTAVVTLPSGTVDVPLLAYPADGEQNYPKGSLLRWQESANAEIYRAQLASANTFGLGEVLLDVDSPDTSETAPFLVAQTNYYWRVVAGNQGGASEFSPVFSFRTGWPSPPVAVSPIGNNIPRDPVFVWSSNEGTSFRLRVVDYQTQVTVLDTTVSDTTLTTPSPFESVKIYQWFVQASNAYGESEWSAEVRFRTSSITFVERHAESPISFSLLQNYPNPFNAETIIPFEIPEAGATTLRIYDILGREVANPVNEELPAGVYSVRFDAYDLPSGTYIYVLTSGSTRLSKKMVLIK